MNTKGSITLIGAVALGVVLLIGAGVAHFSEKKDGPIEQALEGLIEHQTGLEVDFSHDKKESNSEK